MDEGMREKITLFRYGLIAPLLNEQVDRSTYLAAVSAKKHDVPCYGEKTYAAKTILDCLLFYRCKGFDGLKPGTLRIVANPARCRRSSRITCWRCGSNTPRCL